MKQILPTLFLFIITLGNAQNVSIPDAKFKAFLVADATINTDNDSEISITEAEAFTGTMDCSWKSIVDLSGIESFINLNTLNCNYNKLKNLDLSANSKLERLYCNGNSLTDLNLDKLIDLKTLECSSNIIALINLSQNSKLDRLKIAQNQLTGLDLSKNLLLSALGCESNKIENIDISLNVKLTSIDCRNNKLKSLNLNNGKTLFFNLMKSSGNPDLSCIEVDNLSSVRPETWVYDTTSSFSTDCEYNLGVTNFTLDASIKVYPNPANNVVSIRSANPISSLNIYSINGTLIKSLSDTSEIDVSNWSKGIYLFNIEIGNQYLTKEVLVN